MRQLWSATLSGRCMRPDFPRLCAAGRKRSVVVVLREKRVCGAFSAIVSPFLPFLPLFLPMLRVPVSPASWGLLAGCQLWKLLDISCTQLPLSDRVVN